DEVDSPVPVLKIYDLSPSPSSPLAPSPLLLRSTQIPSPSTTPHPITVLTLTLSLDHVLLGFAGGTVLTYRRVDQLLEATAASLSRGEPGATGLGKYKVLYEGKEPVTGLGVRLFPAAPVPGKGQSATLMILTTSHVLSCPLSGKSGKGATVLDDLGGAVGCGAMLEGSEEGSRLVVARDEAVYVYGGDGREACWALEGPKSLILPLTLSSTSHSHSSTPKKSTYLALLAPPTTSPSTSISATLRNFARSTAASVSTNGAAKPTGVGKVTIFDPQNKFVAYSGPFEEGVWGVWEAFGRVWVGVEGGKVFKLTEQPLASSLSTLFQKNLYTLAISLARSRGCAVSEVAEIYRRYGDHLYAKADYEGSMGCYIKTVGTVQASYVIRKFLDAQRLSHLTSYLQELHARQLANSDHTTLLLNCYTKLADDASLSSFIHSSSTSKPTLPPGAPEPSSDEPPFDLETAIRVCRQAGYFDHAVWLAEKYESHSEYLRIQIEDRGDYSGSLAYLRKLGPRVAEESMAKYGKVLLDNRPKETTRFLVDLCCGRLAAVGNGKETNGAEKKEGKEGEKEKEEGDKSYLSYLAYAIPGTAGPEVATNVQEAAMTSATSPSSSPNPSNIAVPRQVSALRTAPETAAANRKSGIFPQGAPPSVSDKADEEASIDEVYLPSPRQFFANYADHPKRFVEFLETVAEKRFGKKSGVGAAVGDEEDLPEPRELLADLGADEDERAIWNTLLELYLESGEETDQRKALTVLKARDRIPYDETRALLVCTTAGFTEGFIMLYEQLGMYDDILRYFIEEGESARVVKALKRYGKKRPYLYKLVLRYLTTSSELLSRHQGDIVDILEVVEKDGIMPPVAVVGILSTNGTASIGLVREYLKRQLSREKEEIDSDRGLITSYRSESAKKRKEIVELSSPDVPRIFQVTRCSACGGQLDLPAVHFMCRHSYHQRCLAENESQCPNCARTHGVIREIRKNNEALADDHELFLDEVRESDDGYAAIAAAFSKGLMSLAKAGEE
ncbi:vacuolar membrane protein, partial [Pseudohyphozyma bogoriensis]